MYFPILRNLEEKYCLDRDLINKFDTWLGIRRPAVRNYLNPNQFSLDTDIDENLAFDLFELSTDEEFNILSMRFVIFLDDSLDLQKTYNKVAEIPNFIEFNDETIEINDSMVKIIFSLKKTPAHPPVLTDLKGGKSGVVHGNNNLPTLTSSRRSNPLRRARRR